MKLRDAAADEQELSEEDQAYNNELDNEELDAEDPESQDDGRDETDVGYDEVPMAGLQPPPAAGLVQFEQPPPAGEALQIGSGGLMKGQPEPKFEQAGAPGVFDPNNSTFEERQKYMTAQERADWASKKFSGPVEKDPTGKPAAAAAAAAPAAAESSADKRARFEQEVFKQIGGDPFGINTVALMDEATRNALPGLFQKVFAGRLVWEDRRRMTKKESEFWDEEVKRFRAHVKDQIEGEKSAKKEAYKEMMGRFDLDQKTREAESKQKAEREAKWREAQGKQVTAVTKAAEALQKQDNTLRSAEMKIMENMSKALEGAASTPAKMEEYNALQAELTRVRSDRDQLRQRLDPGYKQQRLQEEADQKAKMQSAPRDPKATEQAPKAPVIDEAAAREKIKAHPTKGYPVKSQYNELTGEIKVTYKDGTQEIIK
jgi:hypothetical protein